MTGLPRLARTLLDVQTAEQILVLPDVWDVVSARTAAAVPGVRRSREEIRAVVAGIGERRPTLTSPPGAAPPASKLQALGTRASPRVRPARRSR